MKLKVGKKTGLKYFNLSDINGWSPCYDPTRYLSKDFRGTALDILTNGNIPLQDRLWAVLRTAVISEKTLRLFAVWSARQVQHLNTDPRVEACLKTVEEFIAGTASLEQMRQARSGAGNAAAYAADAAYAAYAAAAAADAAYAAYAAAAAYAAYAAAAYAADAADARLAMRERQVAKLVEMVKADGLERVEARKQRQTL
jgi:hypothetical protein